MPSRQDNPANARARARKGSPHRFELIRSKLDPPTARPGLVERVALVRGLKQSRKTRFVSVVAPPGYGKTTLLGQWAARDRRAFAWLSLDHRDNDPLVLLSYVAEALNADGSVEPAVFRALTAPKRTVWSSGLPRLGEALASRREPIVLVLDDVHVLDDPACLDVLSTLALHVPPGSQLVLSGRTAANVGLARMRAEGQLVELGSDALALNDAEAEALLAAAGLELTTTEAAELNRHAEGWAAGLYLAALALAGGKASAATFGGSDRFVTDYLRAEEFSRADPDETDFLLRSAVLETMTGQLCDAVLERSDSAAMLERLERENLFVVPLDHSRSVYRYHHLFREALVAELDRGAPGAVTELQGRAATWCEEHDWVEEAIEYATAAGDRDTLARLVTANVFPYYRRGLVTTVERWLTAFDDDRLAGHPEVATFGAWLHCLRGRPEIAERWALAVDAAVPVTMSDGSPLEAYAASTRALLCRHGIDAMRTDAAAAVAGLTAVSPLRPAAMLLEGVAALLQGDERAEALLTEAADEAFASGAVWAGLVARAELALIALDRGDLTLAQAEAELASELVEGAAPTDYVMTALLHAVTARLAVAQGRGARARQALAAAQRLRPMLTHALSWFSVQIRVELASVHLAVGDRHGAAMLLREVDDILWRRPRLGTLVERAEQLRREVAKSPEAADGWASTLTGAELRLLPLLTTHLSFREIAERLFVSRNTVKTQAISVYRKLGASSRSEAIERAVALGLVDAPATGAQEFTRSG